MQHLLWRWMVQKLPYLQEHVPLPCWWTANGHNTSRYCNAEGRWSEREDCPVSLFIASTDGYRSPANLFGVSRAFVSICIRKVTDVIFKKLKSKYLSIQLKTWSSHLLDNLSNCLLNLKNSGDSTGFEPMTSALPVQCSNQLSYEVTQLRAGQYVFRFKRQLLKLSSKCEDHVFSWFKHRTSYITLLSQYEIRKLYTVLCLRYRDAAKERHRVKAGLPPWAL